MKVLVATEKPFSGVAVKGIKEVFDAAGYEVVMLEKYTEKSQLLDAVKDVDAMIIRSDKVDAEVLDAAKQLKIVVRAGAGYDNIDLAAATAHNVVAMNTPGQNANSVAELVFGLLVFGVRNFFNGTSGTELKGKKLGILAFGNVGRNVARVAKGFDMEVAAYDAYCPAEAIEAAGVKAAKSKESGRTLRDVRHRVAPHSRYARDEAKHQLRPRRQDEERRHPREHSPQGSHRRSRSHQAHGRTSGLEVLNRHQARCRC